MYIAGETGFKSRIARGGGRIKLFACVSSLRLWACSGWPNSGSARGCAWGSCPRWVICIYIGLAEQQTFAERLVQHEGWCAGTPDSKRLSYYVGRLFGHETPSDEIWCRDIKFAERLLIHAHSPAKNTQKELGRLEQELWNIHVVNWRCYRDLLPEVSGARWTARFDDLSCDSHYSIEHFKKA